MACRTNRCGCGSCGCSPCKCNTGCGCGAGSCGCNTPNYSEACGVKEVVDSKLVDGGKYRAVKYKNGCCDKIAKAWIPQTYNTVPNNGPRPISCCAGGNVSNSESECMDSINYLFNHVNPASP